MRARAIELVALLAVWTALPSLPALAAPPARGSREEAVARWERGKEFFQDGDFAAAVIEFRRAYDLFPNYKILYNIGQVCLEQQDYPCALHNFTKYLADGGSNVAPARATDVQREIDRLNARVAHVTITTVPPGADITVDDMPVGKSPLAAPVVVSAGRRRVSASLRGYLTTSKTIEVGGTEQARLAIELLPLTGAASAAAGSVEPRVELTRTSLKLERKHAGPSSWYWAGPAAGAALATSLAIAALVDYRKWDSARKNPASFPNEVADLSARTHGLAVAADVIGSLTIASAAVLVGLQVYARRKESRKHAALQIGVGPGSVTVAGGF